MIKIDYKRCKYKCLFKEPWDDSLIFMLLYIDDILIAAKCMSKVNKLKTLLYREFDMKDLGTAKKIIGMEIRRDKDTGRL